MEGTDMERRWEVKSAVMPLSALAILAFAGMASADSMDGLVTAAKKEGQLTVIALPRDWCGYGAIIDGFKAKYGLTVNELYPDATSGYQLEAIKANQRNTDPEAPDVIDVGLSFGPSAKKDGLLQPYQVSTWSTIPDSAKDADGYWYGDYYGVLAFEINADIVKKAPADWPDLLAPEYKSSVALAGYPQESNQAIQGVFAAGLSAANGSVDQAADQGLKFLAELNKKGNFVPVVGQADSLAQGATPILIRWDYLALGDRDRFKGNPKIEIVVPKTGVVVGVYIQAISAFAPHPNAAKLWMEYLYSDEVQLAWLNGYCHPIRFKDLMSNKKVPVNLLQNLPEDGNYANDDNALFPTMEQQEKAREIITNDWDAVVGVEVECPPDVPSQ
jgi:putative spermidine/putrescine transport system substrate-binding protein